MRRAMLFGRYLPKILAFALVFCAVAVLPHQAADKGSTPGPRPLLVLIFDKAEDCKSWTAQIRSTIAALQKSYAREVEFSEIDVSNTDVSPETLQAARKKAKGLGIGSIFEDAKSLVPLVLIIAADRKNYKEFVGPKSKDDYQDYLKKLLSKPPDIPSK